MHKLKTGPYLPLPVAPIALVGANVDGRANYATVGFISGVNMKPPVIAVSLNHKHHTPKGILENGCFSVNIPSSREIADVDYCGIVSGKDVDKTEVFEPFYGVLERAPMIRACPITCECLYTGKKVEFAMDTVYFGEVIEVYLDPEIAPAPGVIDAAALDPILYSSFENQYRGLGGALGRAWSTGAR